MLQTMYPACVPHRVYDKLSTSVRRLCTSQHNSCSSHSHRRTTICTSSLCSKIQPYVHRPSRHSSTYATKKWIMSASTSHLIGNAEPREMLYNCDRKHKRTYSHEGIYTKHPSRPNPFLRSITQNDANAKPQTYGTRSSDVNENSSEHSHLNDSILEHTPNKASDAGKVSKQAFGSLDLSEREESDVVRTADSEVVHSTDPLSSYRELIDNHVIPDTTTMDKLSQQWSASGNWGMILAFLEEVNRLHIPISDHLLRSGLRACSEVPPGEGNLTATAEDLLHELYGREGVEVETADFNNLLKTCQNARKPVLARKIFNDIRKYGVGPDRESFNTVLAACGHGGRLRTCISLLESMIQLNIMPDDVSYHSVIHACKIHDRWELAVEYLQRMHNNDVKPSTHTYNTAIATCIPRNRYAEAMEMFMEMPQCGVAYDTITYNTVMRMCNGMEAWDMTQKLFNAMREHRQGMISKPSTMIDSLIPDYDSYDLVLLAYAKTKNLHGALNLLRTSPVDGVVLNTVMYNHILSLCDKHRRWPEAVSVLARMAETQVAYSSHTYNAAISLCRWGGGCDEAVRLLREMTTKAYKPDVYSYTSAISVCQKFGEWETALNLLQEMQDRGVKPNTYTFNTAIATCATADKWEKALELFKEMEGTGVTRDRDTYGILVECLVRCGSENSLVDTLYDNMTQSVPEVQKSWAKLREKGELDLHHHNVNLGHAAVRRLMVQLLQEQRTAEVVENPETSNTNTRSSTEGEIQDHCDASDEISSDDRDSLGVSESEALRIQPGLKRIVVGKSGQKLIDAVRTQLSQMQPPIRTHVLKQLACIKLDKKDLTRWLLTNK